jgi:Tfp pilus assembly protein PilX
MAFGRHHRSSCFAPGSDGAILLLALVFLLLLSIVAARVMKTGALQLRMSGNDQFAEEAVQQAQAVATEVSLEPRNFLLESMIDDTNCLPADPRDDCTFARLLTPHTAQLDASLQLQLQVTRQDPLVWRGMPIRESQHSASSSNSFDAALFEVEVAIDGSERRLGSARVVRGIAVRMPALR